MTNYYCTAVIQPASLTSLSPSNTSQLPHSEHVFFSDCSTRKVSSGLVASPTSHFVAPLRNQTPSPLQSLNQELCLKMARTVVASLRRPLLQWLRPPWMTWMPCVLAPPATSALVMTTLTWAPCHGYSWREEARIIKVKLQKLGTTLLWYLLKVPYYTLFHQYIIGLRYIQNMSLKCLAIYQTDRAL